MVLTNLPPYVINPPLLGTAVFFHGGSLSGRHCLLRRGISDDIIFDSCLIPGTPTLSGRIRSKLDWEAFAGKSGSNISEEPSEMGNFFWGEVRTQIATSFTNLSQMDYTRLERAHNGMLIGIPQVGIYKGRAIALSDQIGEFDKHSGNSLQVSYDDVNGIPGGSVNVEGNYEINTYLAGHEITWLSKTESDQLTNLFDE